MKWGTSSAGAIDHEMFREKFPKLYHSNNGELNATKEIIDKMNSTAAARLTCHFIHNQDNAIGGEA